MHLTTHQVDKITIVTLTGRIDALSAEALLASLLTLLKQNPPFLLIDMTKVDYLSSAGMRTFLVTVREAELMQGKVVFANFCKLVREILHLAGLSKHFTHYSSLEEARAAFS